MCVCVGNILFCQVHNNGSLVLKERLRIVRASSDVATPTYTFVAHLRLEPPAAEPVLASSASTMASTH